MGDPKALSERPLFKYRERERERERDGYQGRDFEQQNWPCKFLGRMREVGVIILFSRRLNHLLLF